MFCSKCGSQIPEGGSCPNCCQEKQTTVVNDVLIVDNTKTTVKLKKGKYIKNLAPESVKTFSLVGLIATILCVVFFIGCYFSFFNTSFDEMLVVKISGVDVDEATDELKDSSDKLGELIEKAEDDSDIDDDFINATKDVHDSIEDSIDSFSLKNIDAFLDSAYEYNDICEDYDEYDDKMDMSVFDNLKTIINVISYVVIGFIVFCAIFTLLGGFFKKNVLVIIGMLFTLLFCLALCGIVFVVIGVALHIILIVSNSIVNSSYRKYKKSL